MSDLDIYRDRVMELRGQGQGSTAAGRTAMDEAHHRIHHREEAWHDIQQTTPTTEHHQEVTR